MKGWEACEEAEKHATEWYEFKMEDLHYENLDGHIAEDEVAPEGEAPAEKK